ncbi:retinal rod rhodopsin-sensitive cGMP 3',5'-cyclic phosphodiesterase subunit delta-like isoform X2 [Aphis gossypii]|uniref:retinal rod rhodopsin-sensitive cGMP 3',5'-cyclic phosphodiesterase subunit delta-like isoform X2 n=1 Tax=Aphis gossypii TaxID=80765 RepID=UPI002158D126|nr:retinal rod rhodopsin-sensitive cGMP 3',5'-cyclic phosphodiesterase subunit delta-like isoform X2 [Aphis gossypii]
MVCSARCREYLKSFHTDSILTGSIWSTTTREQYCGIPMIIISGNKYMITVTMPKKVLDCRALTRTISFTSMHRIDHLKMRHRELVSLQCVHEWVSDFGIVLPNLNETWETTFINKEGISSSSTNFLSGDLVIETSFYNGDKFIGSTHILLYFQ